MLSNYYNILGCASSATYDEIRGRYLELVKQNHPDKQNQLNSSKSLTKTSCNTFIEIDQAWKVLRDEKLRREYDETLLQQTIDNALIIYADLKINELHFEQGVSSFICRCGAAIEISKADFSKTIEQTDKLYYECNECSNTICVSG